LIHTLKPGCSRYGPLLCALMTLQSLSIGVRNLHIDELISASDVIVVAEVTDVTASGPGKLVVFRDQLLQSEAYVGNLTVMRTIRGSAPEHITIRYNLPLSFVGYQGLHTGVRLVFLRKEKAGFSLADPYYPDFPALPTVAGIGGQSHAGGDYKTATLGEMLAVIASSNTSSAEKSEILRVDYALPHNKDVIAALKEGLSSVHDPELRQRIQGELLRFGDVSELPDVANLLLANLATENQRIWLLYVIGNRVSDARAIPALQPLVASEESSIREAAVEALWHIADPTAVPLLLKSLNDTDEQVRFYAVRAFSDIANEPSWGGPSELQFHQHQQEYLTHWQSWAGGRTQ